MMSTAIPGPLRVGDLLDRAFRLFRARLAPLLLVSAVCLVPLAIASGLVLGQFATDYFDLFTSAAGSRATPATTRQMLVGAANFYGLLALLLLVSVPVNGLASLATVEISAAALHARRLTVGESLRLGARRVVPYIGLLVVQFLAIAGVTLLALIPLALVIGLFIAAIVASGTGGNPGPAAIVGFIVVGIALYLLLLVWLVAPGVYLATRWIAAVPSLVVEGLGPMAALRRSWRLTRGQFWRCLGYLVLLFLLGSLVTWLPLTIIQQSLLVALGPANIGWVAGASSGFSQIGNVIWLPLYGAASVMLYYDLRVRQESYDVALRVERMEAEVAARAPGGSPSNDPPPDASAGAVDR